MVNIEKLLNRFPNLELSYETNVHKKVQSYDFCLAIPKGQKYFAWFTYYENQNICVLLEISKNKIIVIHKERNKEQKIWEGNPYWARVDVDMHNAKLKNYLTLAGKGRHIELGAFLSPDERIELRDKIQIALAKANSA